jgi:uncharacterized protein DUF1206
VARGVFSLLLAGLAVDVAVDHGSTSQQADPNGALSVIAGNPIGFVAVVATAVFFVGFGVVRIAGALRDRRVEAWRRVTTALQGLLYLGAAVVPASYAFGSRQAGSEQQQHRDAAAVLSWPGGRELVIAGGVVVLVVCAWQVRSAIVGDFADGMDTDRAPWPVRRLVEVAGAVGIAARALVYAPVGVFLIVAGVLADPGRAYGVDGELARAAQHPWGEVVLFGVAAALVVFAVYSFLEAGYRRVARGR